MSTETQLRLQVEAARQVILRGVELLDDRVGEWEGVRAWLEQDETEYTPSERDTSQPASPPNHKRIGGLLTEWVMVPLTMSQEMWQAARAVLPDGHGNIEAIWDAMLAAAPRPLESESARYVSDYWRERAEADERQHQKDRAAWAAHTYADTAEMGALKRKLACKCICEFTGSGNERKINKRCTFHQSVVTQLAEASTATELGLARSRSLVNSAIVATERAEAAERQLAEALESNSNLAEQTASYLRQAREACEDLAEAKKMIESLQAIIALLESNETPPNHKRIGGLLTEWEKDEMRREIIQEARSKSQAKRIAAQSEPTEVEAIRNGGGDCIHCWHDTGKMLMSNPPISVEICCHCGAEQHLRLLTIVTDGPEHGPFTPNRLEPQRGPSE